MEATCRPIFLLFVPGLLTVHCSGSRSGGAPARMAACKVTLTGGRRGRLGCCGGKDATWFWVAEVLAAVVAAGAVAAAPVVVALVVAVLATALVLWAVLAAVATAALPVPGFRLGTFSGQGVATTGAGAGAGAGRRLGDHRLGRRQRGLIRRGHQRAVGMNWDTRPVIPGPGDRCKTGD